MNKSIVYMDGTLVFFQASCLARCVLCGRCTVENSHEHGRNARHFFDTAFSSAVYCAAGAPQKTTVYRDGTLANFSMNLSSSLGTVRPSCFEKMRSAWTELSPFFSENLLVCFCGSTIHADHNTDFYDFSMKKVPF